MPSISNIVKVVIDQIALSILTLDNIKTTINAKITKAVKDQIKLSILTLDSIKNAINAEIKKNFETKYNELANSQFTKEGIKASLNEALVKKEYLEKVVDTIISSNKFSKLIASTDIVNSNVVPIKQGVQNLVLSLITNVTDLAILLEIKSIINVVADNMPNKFVADFANIEATINTIYDLAELRPIAATVAAIDTIVVTLASIINNILGLAQNIPIATTVATVDIKVGTLASIIDNISTRSTTAANNINTILNDRLFKLINTIRSINRNSRLTLNSFLDSSYLRVGRVA